jgi:hypothetical protein
MERDFVRLVGMATDPLVIADHDRSDWSIDDFSDCEDGLPPEELACKQLLTLALRPGLLLHSHSNVAVPQRPD